MIDFDTGLDQLLKFDKISYEIGAEICTLDETQSYDWGTDGYLEFLFDIAVKNVAKESVFTIPQLMKYKYLIKEKIK